MVSVVSEIVRNLLIKTWSSFSTNLIPSQQNVGPQDIKELGAQDLVDHHQKAGFPNSFRLQLSAFGLDLIWFFTWGKWVVSYLSSKKPCLVWAATWLPPNGLGRPCRCFPTSKECGHWVARPREESLVFTQTWKYNCQNCCTEISKLKLTNRSPLHTQIARLLIGCELCQMTCGAVALSNPLPVAQLGPVLGIFSVSSNCRTSCCASSGVWLPKIMAWKGNRNSNNDNSNNTIIKIVITIINNVTITK